MTWVEVVLLLLSIFLIIDRILLIRRMEQHVSEAEIALQNYINEVNRFVDVVQKNTGLLNQALAKKAESAEYN